MGCFDQKSPIVHLSKPPGAQAIKNNAILIAVLFHNICNLVADRSVIFFHINIDHKPRIFFHQLTDILKSADLFGMNGKITFCRHIELL